jgi:hypothetical protein
MPAISSSSGYEYRTSLSAITIVSAIPSALLFDPKTRSLDQSDSEKVLNASYAHTQSE